MLQEQSCPSLIDVSYPQAAETPRRETTPKGPVRSSGGSLPRPPPFPETQQVFNGPREVRTPTLAGAKLPRTPGCTASLERSSASQRRSGISPGSHEVPGQPRISEEKEDPLQGWPAGKDEKTEKAAKD